MQHEALWGLGWGVTPSHFLFCESINITKRPMSNSRVPLATNRDIPTELRVWLTARLDFQSHPLILVFC
jgi:hypothetical protein